VDYLFALPHLVSRIGLHGLYLAALIFFLEGIGTPIPVEIPLGTLAYYIAHHRTHPLTGILLMFSSTILGNLVGYALGYWGGRPLALRLFRLFGLKEAAWKRMENWFHRNGMRAVVVTRWINWGFAQNMWLCGITRVPLRRFMPVMLINNLLWATVWVYFSSFLLTFFRRRGIHLLHGLIEHLPWVFLGAVLIIWAGWWGWKRFRSHAMRQTAAPESE
jgi:membrane protein DedA with SNARE-associated domain